MSLNEVRPVIQGSHSTCPALTTLTHHLGKEATWILILWAVPPTKVCSELVYLQTEMSPCSEGIVSIG